MNTKTRPAADKNIRILITISKEHVAVLKKYAKKHDMLRGGEPNVSEALRATSAEGLGKPELSESVVMGNPEQLSSD